MTPNQVSLEELASDIIGIPCVLASDWNVWRKKYACLPRIINTYITRLSWLLWWEVCVCVLQRDWSISCKSSLPSGFYPWPKSCLINGPALLNSKTPLNFESFSLITPSPRAKAQGNSKRPGEYKTRERFLNKRIWQTTKLFGENSSFL